MKTFSFFIIGLSLLFFLNKGLCNANADGQTGSPNNTSALNTLNIQSSPDLNNLADRSQRLVRKSSSGRQFFKFYF